MDSILTSTKKLLGITEDYTPFDVDLVTFINSTFGILVQLGVGPSQGFSIQDDTAVWTDFIPDSMLLASVKTYVYLKVRLLFDPPASSTAVSSMERLISEFEWRMNVEAEA